MVLMVIMVQIGKTIKFDGNGRITIPMELAKLLNLEKGMDEIYWDVTGGLATLKKVTKKYHGLDFEGDEIRETTEVRAGLHRELWSGLRGSGDVEDKGQAAVREGQGLEGRGHPQQKQE